MSGFLKWKAPKEERMMLLALVLIEMPFAFAFFYLIRMPLVDGLVQLVLDKNSGIYRFVTIFYAPITEEPAKFLPALLPFFYKRLEGQTALRAALALGLGFGIGEIWLVANFITAAPGYADTPWYMFTGFMNERFMVCIIHGVFTAAALRKLKSGFIWGVLTAMLLHYTGNFPIYLARIDFGSLGIGTWQTIIAVYTQAFFVFSLLLLSYYFYGSANLGKLLFGNSICPECHAVYPAPLVGVNMVGRRYEKCRNCKKWHWVTHRKDEQLMNP
jgi:hypothetical protein